MYVYMYTSDTAHRAVERVEQISLSQHAKDLGVLGVLWCSYVQQSAKHVATILRVGDILVGELSIQQVIYNI